MNQKAIPWSDLNYERVLSHFRIVDGKRESAMRGMVCTVCHKSRDEIIMCKGGENCTPKRADQG